MASSGDEDLDPAGIISDVQVTDGTHELTCWEDVNRSLRHHGLPPLTLRIDEDIETVERFYLDLVNSALARENYISLVADCDHRQAIIRDLIVSNDQLKEQANEQSATIEDLQSQVQDFRVMLESSRSRSKELEDDLRRQSDASIRLSDDYTRRLSVGSDKFMDMAKYREMVDKCQKRDHEIEQLTRRMDKIKQEENNRELRQSSVFQEFMKRTARTHSAMDEKLLDVIDSYEKQLTHLRKELQSNTLETDISHDVLTSSSNAETHVSENIKVLIKGYEKQLKESKKKAKKLEEEQQLIKLDVDHRPSLKEYRVAQQRIKKLERLIASHKISMPGSKQEKDPFSSLRKKSTRIADLDELPLNFCHQYLKELTSELGVTDLKDIVTALTELKGSESGTDVLALEKFALGVHLLMRGIDGFSLSRQNRSVPMTKTLPSAKSLHSMLAILQEWRNDVSKLQELQETINKISEKLAPELGIHLSGEAPVADMIDTLEKVTGSKTYKKGKNNTGPSKAVLQSMVRHIQVLFDIPSVSGVYARMNDVYTKQGEVLNVLNTLRHLLDLASGAKASAVVDAVARLCEDHRTTTAEQLRRILDTNDLTGVVQRLEEHAAFFPIFQEVMKRLMHILDVERVDQVIPAVRALKLLSS